MAPTPITASWEESHNGNQLPRTPLPNIVSMTVRIKRSSPTGESTSRTLPLHRKGRLRFVLSHPFRDETAKRMGHPAALERMDTQKRSLVANLPAPHRGGLATQQEVVVPFSECFPCRYRQEVRTPPSGV